MNPEQVQQISRQIEAYEKQKGDVTITVPLGSQSFSLRVDQFVANPGIMNSGVQLVEYLAENPSIVKDKTIGDMGTGAGILGVASALLGARFVLMSDIDEHAVNNARSNVRRLKLTDRCDVFWSDLFNEYGGRAKAQVQLFNHPFFSGDPIAGKTWTRMMLGGTDLIGRYFERVPRYSTPDAVYILPWLVLAEKSGAQLDNDPGKRASAYGYQIDTVVERDPVAQSIQAGPFRIYVLRKNY